MVLLQKLLFAVDYCRMPENNLIQREPCIVTWMLAVSALANKLKKTLDVMENEWYINQATFEADNLILQICLFQIHGEVSKWS